MGSPMCWARSLYWVLRAAQLQNDRSPTCMVEPQGCTRMKSDQKTLNLCWFDGKTRSSKWCGNHWVQSWSCRLCIGKNGCQCVSWSNDCMYAHWLIIEELANVHMKTMDSRQLTLRLICVNTFCKQILYFSEWFHCWRRQGFPSEENKVVNSNESANGSASEEEEDQWKQCEMRKYWLARQFVVTRLTCNLIFVVACLTLWYLLSHDTTGMILRWVWKSKLMLLWTKIWSCCCIWSSTLSRFCTEICDVETGDTGC